MKVSIGIDPGINGAIAAINPVSMEVLGLVDTPTIKKKLYDIGAMAEIIRGMSLLGSEIATLEQAQAMPGQGVTSTFSTGRSFGLWEGILGALDVPFRTVRPAIWTRRVLEGVCGQGKERSILFAMRMFPGAELIPSGCRSPRDGRADALCLAYYGALVGKD
jgi:crossover junction endodeoxyribonuclease RuvC